MTQLTPTPSKRPSDQARSDEGPHDEMPDPDNLRVDRTSLMTLPIQLPPAPAIGERLFPARHRADYSRGA